MPNPMDYVSAQLSRRPLRPHACFLYEALWHRIDLPLLPFRTEQFLLQGDEYELLDCYFPSLHYAVCLSEKAKLPSLRDFSPLEALHVCSLAFESRGKIQIRWIEPPKDDSQQQWMAFINRIRSVTQEIQELAKQDSTYLEFDEAKHRKMRLVQKEALPGDEFLSMAEVVSCFSEETPAFFRSTLWLEKGMVWSPSLASHGSNRDGCLLGGSPDFKHVLELADRSPIRAQELFEAEKEAGTPRYLFLRCKDPSGYSPRVFLGVYQALSYEEKQNAVVWEKVGDSLPYPVH